MVWMDAGCTVDGFRSDFGRAGVIGGPSTDQQDAQRRIWEVTIEPGVATEFGIFHVEQDVVVTPEGPEVISLAPWSLRRIPA